MCPASEGYRIFRLNQDKLAKKIAQAGDEGWTTLDLYEEEIDYLAAEIGNLQSITELDLGGNGLTALPPRLRSRPKSAGLLRA